LLISIAAILGDTVNYWIGHYLGPKSLRKIQNFSNESTLKEPIILRKTWWQNHNIGTFYSDYTDICTFRSRNRAMSYGKFILYNIIGGIAWVALFIYAGYFFGTLPVVKNNFSLVIYSNHYNFSNSDSTWIFKKEKNKINYGKYPLCLEKSVSWDVRADKICLALSQAGHKVAYFADGFMVPAQRRTLSWHSYCTGRLWIVMEIFNSCFVESLVDKEIKKQPLGLMPRWSLQENHACFCFCKRCTQPEIPLIMDMAEHYRCGNELWKKYKQNL